MSYEMRGLDLRKQGKRRTKRTRDGISDVFKRPLNDLIAGTPFEVRVSTDQMTAIHQLYTTSPSIQAARSVLMGQLLSSGIVLRRKGKDVALTEGFAKHLEGVWIPFARNVADAFIQYGFCAVSIEEENPPPFESFRRRVREGQRAAQDREDVYNYGDTQRTGDAVATNHAIDGDELDATKNLVPNVCELGTYDVCFQLKGRRGYKRTYTVSSNDNAHSMQVDADVGIFFKSEPDGYGNINSSIATCFEQASFIAALQELALNAEVVRARTQLVTQPAPKGNNGAVHLDAANMFFDSESRAIQEQDQANANDDQASALSLMVRLCESMNKAQTTQPNNPVGTHSAHTSHVPPEVRKQMRAMCARCATAQRGDLCACVLGCRRYRLGSSPFRRSNRSFLIYVRQSHAPTSSR